MKTTIHLAVAIGAMSLLASCAQESVLSREYDPDQIAYKAFANNATKSGAVDNEHLGNIGDLYVSAIKLNDAGYYFSNNVISSGNVSSSSANSGNTPYYWPAYKLGFYAANRSMTVTESSAVKLTPSIDNFTVSRRALNDPDELMVALEAQQRDGNGTPVQLGLHHALSRLTIQVQKTIPGYDISVAGVQIGGFKSVGTFTFPQYNTTNAASDAAWEGLVSANYGNANNLHTCWGSLSTPLQYGDLNISNDALSGTAMTSSAQNIMGGAYFYVIPQGVTLTTAASGSSPDITDHWIDLLVNVRSSASGVQIYPASADAGKYAVTRIYIPASQVFEAGKSYTVTLNFSNGIGVSESIQANGNIEEIYAGTLAKAIALSSSNLKKVVAPEFPDDTFILGSAIDYVASASEWVAGTYGEQPVINSVPAGAIAGLYTVNENGDQVYFSKGNLQCYLDNNGEPTAYGEVTYGWKFADEQYEYIGTNGKNVEMSYGWVDLYGWSADGGLNPFGLSNDKKKVNYTGSFVDWGTNRIYNGTNIDPCGTWRTLGGEPWDWKNMSGDPWTESDEELLSLYSEGGEWGYILERRSSVTVNGVDDARYADVMVNSIRGILLFPDEWNEPLSESLQSLIPQERINIFDAPLTFSANLSLSDWPEFESAGCVFLPAAGKRSSGVLYQCGERGLYWTSTTFDAYEANSMYFNAEEGPHRGTGMQYRSDGASVRLVQDK